ncbi:MAG: hypothetical protein HYS86_04130 [Candidatus Chisholmbacteria bacterium]|nr:hypothetical protein [Candidatus Chisholmbacteria bacterium]
MSLPTISHRQWQGVFIGVCFVLGVGAAILPGKALANHVVGTVGPSGQLETPAQAAANKPAEPELFNQLTNWLSSTWDNVSRSWAQGSGVPKRVVAQRQPGWGQVLGAKTQGLVLGAKTALDNFFDWVGSLFSSSPSEIASEEPQASPKPSKPVKTVVAAEPEPEVVSTGELTAGDGISISLADVISVVASALAGNGLISSNNNLDVDVGTTAKKIVQLDANGLYPAASGRKITDMDAANINYGILGTDRLDGKYGKIQAVGTLTEGTWNANIIADAYIANDLTLSGVTFSGASTLSDDTKLSFGTGGVADFLWETADANANELIVAFDEGGAIDVPVLVVGDASIDNVDLGMFNGVTDPSIAVVSDDAGDYGRIFVTDAGVFTLRSGTGDIALQADNDTGDFFQFSSDGTDLTLSGADAAGITVLTDKGAAAGLVLVSSAGGIDISTGSAAAGNDIDLLSGSSINLTAGESAADSIVLTSSAGGIDILASGAAAGEDIDIIATGSSVNLSSTEGIENAITLVSSAGGINISTGSGAAANDIDLLSGSSINLTAAESAADSIVLTSSAGGIDILATGAAAGEDIDIAATGSSVNISATESVANAITLTTSSAAGGIDLSTGGQGGQGGAIDILSGNAAATAITIVAPQGGIDISTGSATQDIDILGGASLNLRAAESAADAITIFTLGAAGGIDISTGGQLGQGGSIDLLGGQGAATAITIVAPQGGIDISTGSATQDIDILGGASLNLRASESAADAITLFTLGAAGGIDLSTGGQLGQGGSIDILSGQAAAAALTLVSAQGGIDISTGSGAAGNDIDLLSGSSINLTAAESAADSIVLTSSAGGIDILATGAAAGEDIDIRATGSSINLFSTESVADAITLSTSSAAGGIDLSTGGQGGQGGAIDILSGNAAAAALTLVSAQGGIDISTGSGAAGNDIDLLGGSSVNLRAAESVADAITLITTGAAGGIDLSTGGQLGQGGSIDILSGQAAATAITIVAPQGGIDISTGSGTGDIDILSGDAVTVVAGTNGISMSGGTDTVNASGIVITGGNTSLNGDVDIDATATATGNGVCHSGADSDTVFYDRTLVACTDTVGDLAEWYETSSGVGPGDVVVLSGKMIEYSYTPLDPFTGMQIEGVTRTEKVAVLGKSTASYSPYLVGVVSTSPYQAFGDAIRSVAQNPQPIALSGRVPVKVTNENGPIAAGDYLTSSSTPGFAMRASKGGMVVGTALEGFDGESGQIMVFVGKGYVASEVYDQMALLAALGASAELLETGEVLGLETASLASDLGGATGVVETVAVTAEAVTETAAGEVVAQSDGEVLAAGAEALPVVKTQVVDELTVTTAATFEGSVLVLGDATFQGKLTVNGIEVKGDVNLTGAVTVVMTAGGSVSAGDPVAVNGDGSVSRAGGGRPVVGVAASGAGAGGSVRVAVAGRVGGLSGLSAGARYFVDEAGGLTTEAAGNQALGVALSGSELLVQPGVGWPGVVPELSAEAPVETAPEPGSAAEESLEVAPEASAAASATSETAVGLVVPEPEPSPLPTPSAGIISPLP